MDVIENTPQPTATASLVYNYIIAKKDEDEFTSPDIAKDIARPVNQVSAALTSMTRSGLIKPIDRLSHRKICYRIADRNVDLVLRPKANKSATKPNYTTHGPSKSPHVKARTIADKLVELAAQIEAMEPDLSALPTDVLLRELIRRERKDKRDAE